MPTVSINHMTRYRYSRDVAFGEHRILVRPRESYDQRLLSSSLEIDPEPASLRWLQDVFGNAVAIATFDKRAEYLVVSGKSEVEHLPTAPEDIAIEPYAQSYPFTYTAQDIPDLLRSIERQYPDPGRMVDEWARSFLPQGKSTSTFDLLVQMTNAIKRDFNYARREEKGIQSPLETLSSGGGTCRDYAMLMIEAVRALGLAAQFVSGYLYTPKGSNTRIGGHSTHAWLSVFLPGSGWVEFDPTNAIVGNQGLIRVAVARDPIHAKPLSGSWIGVRGSQIDMEVDVRIKHVDVETRHADFQAKTPAG